MAHPAWPWQDEQLAVALHKPNTWIDLSGWSPRRFAPDLVRNIKGPLQDRVLFGTDYPFLSHEQWFGAWDTLDVPERDHREGAAARTRSACSGCPPGYCSQHSVGERLADALALRLERDVGERRVRRQRRGVGGQAVEVDPRRAAAVGVVPRDGDGSSSRCTRSTRTQSGSRCFHLSRDDA